MGKHTKFEEDEEEKDEELDQQEEIDDEDGDEFQDEQAEQDDEEQDHDDDEVSLQEKLAQIPFEDLQKLKKNGSNVGNLRKITKERIEERKKEGLKKGKQKKQKDSPAELSSKIPVSRFRVVVPSKKQPAKDPRFSEKYGRFKEESFNKAYAFLEDYKDSEIKELKAQITKEKDPEQLENLQKGLNIMSERRKTEKRKEEQKKRLQVWSKQEKLKIGQGKSPYFLKKSDAKELELVDKFNELKKKKKLDKFMVTKMIKNEKKVKRFRPYNKDGTIKGQKVRPT